MTLCDPKGNRPRRRESVSHRGRTPFEAGLEAMADGLPMSPHTPRTPRSARSTTPRRALPRLPAVAAATGDMDARQQLHQTLDDMHWGLAAKSLVGSHRKGKKNDWMRGIYELDLPPWSMRGAGMARDAAKPMTPRSRRVQQSLGTGNYCLHSDEHVSKHLAQRYAHGRAPAPSTSPRPTPPTAPARAAYGAAGLQARARAAQGRCRARPRADEQYNSR